VKTVLRFISHSPKFSMPFLKIDLVVVTFSAGNFDIVAASFIGGGNRSTRRKPQTCRKSLISLIT
jgi:hypothetical protein